MKRVPMLLLCLALMLALALTGCGVKEGFVPPDKDLDAMPPNERQCAAYIEEIRDGEGLAAQLIDAEEPGIMNEVVKTLTYEILSTEEQADGSILCTLEIKAIDMEALLEAVGDAPQSEEEARAMMLEMARDAERTVFPARMTLVPSETEGEYDIQYDNDFVNAVTGGMLNLILEAYDLMEVAE